MVLHDGIDPKVAHKAFLAIDEFRMNIAPDIEGAAGEHADLYRSMMGFDTPMR